MSSRDHRHETRQHPLPQRYCIEPGCKFFNQPAQQGICHTSEPEIIDWQRVADAGEQLAKSLKPARDSMPVEEYATYLEANYECAMVNWTMTLDECIRLRREVALLKLAAAKRQGRLDQLKARIWKRWNTGRFLIDFGLKHIEEEIDAWDGDGDAPLKVQP